MKIVPEMLIGVDKIIFLTDDKEKIPEWLNKYSCDHWKIENFPSAPTLEKSKEVIMTLKEKINNILN